MRFLLTAFLFLSAVVLFTLIAKVIYQGSVETELERQGSSVLKSAGFDGVGVTFDHHDARLFGFVDSQEQIVAAREVLQRAIPIARLPELDLTEIAIRPTIPPALKIVSSADAAQVEISGTLGEDGESVRALLGSRLTAIASGQVDNLIELDPMRILVERVNEFAAVSVELVRQSESALVEYKEGDLTLSGTVSNDGIKEGILELADLFEPSSIRDEIEVVDPRSFLQKSTLVVTRNRFGLTLSGLRSPEEEIEIQSMLLSAFPNLAISDRREESEDRIPGYWVAHAETALPALIELLHGEMTVEFGEQQIRLTGVTASRENREAILAAIQPILNEDATFEVLADLRIEDPAELMGPPSEVLIRFQKGLLTLEGRVPDDSFAADLEAPLQEIVPDLLVNNALTVEERAQPAAWIENLSLFLSEALSRTEEGSFQFSESAVRLEGTTIEITDKAMLQNIAVNSVPPGFTIENQLVHPDDTFPTPELLPEARAQLAESLKQFPIYFDTNSEIVNSTGREKVEAIASLIKETGAEVDLIATGFADNVGNAAYNRELSLRRAAAVVEALVALEISEESLVTKSEGEDVSGLSRSERWKARRVEVSLAPEIEPEESEN